MRCKVIFGISLVVGSLNIIHGRKNVVKKRQLSTHEIPSLQSHGKACNFYLWDAGSALLHKWCNHLIKDCIYEGMGGKKFVRIRPGSILQLIYDPKSNYSPDRCCFCGGYFRDHLTLWWSKKHLYKPFDLWLSSDQENYGAAPMPNKSGKRSKRTQQIDTVFLKHRYHKKLDRSDEEQKDHDRMSPTLRVARLITLLCLNSLLHLQSDDDALGERERDQISFFGRK